MRNITVQAILSYFWSVITAVIFGYVIFAYGDQKEILLLVIGYFAGTINQILGVYFSANKDKEPTKTVTHTMEDGSVKVTEETK